MNEIDPEMDRVDFGGLGVQSMSIGSYRMVVREPSLVEDHLVIVKSEAYQSKCS